MALLTEHSRCAICGERLGEERYLATSGVFFPVDDPLWSFCDAPLHWDCYEHWPHRSRFARQYVSGHLESESANEYWGRVLLTDLVYLAVRKREPGVAAVWLFETGTSVRVALSQWSAWLWDLGMTEDELHRLEVASLWKVLPELRRRFPNPEAMLAVVDWEAKERLGKVKEKVSAERMRAHLDAIETHNSACCDLVRMSGQRGLTCPHCGGQSKDIEFVDHAGTDRKSFFVCQACGRSFGHGGNVSGCVNEEKAV
jgi:hypothetical protein